MLARGVKYLYYPKESTLDNVVVSSSFTDCITYCLTFSNEDTCNPIICVFLTPVLEIKHIAYFCITTGNKVNLKILLKIELGGDVIRCILHSWVNSCIPVYEYKPHLKEQIKSAHNSALQRRGNTLWHSTLLVQGI